MNRYLRVVICGFFILVLFSVVPASVSYAQTNDSVTQDRLFLENIEKFKKWREGIPDFEKRLYDRVKAVNRRVIRVQNLVIASFFLLLIINIVFLVLLQRRLAGKTGSRPTGIRTTAKPDTEQQNPPSQ